MPYSKPSDAPAHVPAKYKAQWVEVFNSSYKKAKDEKKSDKEADAVAFRNANGVIKRRKETGNKVAAAPDVRELFAPITKVYDGPDGFFVDGVLVAEEPDRTREIWDYATSKSQVLAWADDFAAKTGGKSVGNLRAMHGQVAAGKFVSVEPDDAGKRFDVRAEVVDEQEKEKVRKGVYTGFSIKAPYARKWVDPANPRYTRWTQGPMIESSLVDLPCVYSAVFNDKFAFKATGVDGQVLVEEERDFSALVSPAVESLATKGMYEVADFAELCMELESLRRMIEIEREIEGDTSPVTDRICSYVDGLLDAFLSYAGEQVAEMQHRHSLNYHSKSYEEDDVTTTAAKVAHDPNDADCKCAKCMGEKAIKAAKAAFDGAKKAFDELMAIHASSPSGDGIGPGDHHGGSSKSVGDQGQSKSANAHGYISIGKTAEGVEIFKLDPAVAAKSAIAEAVAEQLKPLSEAMEKFVAVAAKMAGVAIPSGVAVREGVTIVDKGKDGAAEAERAAKANDTAAKSASDLAKEGKPVDAVKAIHAAGPALVMTNRGLERPGAPQ